MSLTVYQTPKNCTAVCVLQLRVIITATFARHRNTELQQTCYKDQEPALTRLISHKPLDFTFSRITSGHIEMNDRPLFIMSAAALTRQ